jgi:hypothetical protein
MVELNAKSTLSNPHLLKLTGEGDVDKIMDTFLLAYRTTPNATLPQQRRPAELLFGRKPRTTLDFLLPTKQPAGCDTKIERQFNLRHGAVQRTSIGETLSMFVTANPMTGWQDQSPNESGPVSTT